MRLELKEMVKGDLKRVSRSSPASVRSCEKRQKRTTDPAEKASSSSLEDAKATARGCSPGVRDSELATAVEKGGECSEQEDPTLGNGEGGGSCAPEEALRRSKFLASKTAVWNALRADWEERSVELQRFIHLVGSVPVVVVHGDASTGKSSLVKSVVRKLFTTFVFIDGQICYTTGDIYGYILAKLPLPAIDGVNSRQESFLSEGEDSDSEEGRDFDDGNDYEANRKKNIQENLAAMEAFFAESTTEAFKGSSKQTQSSNDDVSFSSVSNGECALSGKNAWGSACLVLEKRSDYEKFHEFSLEFSFRFSQMDSQPTPIHIVVDRAEKVALRFPTVLESLVQFCERSGGKVTLSLIFQVVPRRIEQHEYLAWVPRVQLKAHSKSVLTGLLFSKLKSSQPNTELDNSLLKDLAKFVLDTFFLKSRDLRELTFVALDLFQFLELTRGEDAEPLSSLVLPNLLRERIRLLSQRMYNHDLDLDLAAGKHGTAAQWEEKEEEKRSTLSTAEIPYNSKVLLVAGFLASYNSSDADRKIFGTYKAVSNRTKKLNANRQLKSQNSNRPPQVEIGPKRFKIERLFWIYRALLTELQGEGAARKSFGDDMYKHLSTLENAGLLVRVSPEEELHDIQLKCTIPHSYANAIGRSLSNFSLQDYLVQC